MYRVNICFPVLLAIFSSSGKRKTGNILEEVIFSLLVDLWPRLLLKCLLCKLKLGDPEGSRIEMLAVAWVNGCSLYIFSHLVCRGVERKREEFAIGFSSKFYYFIIRAPNPCPPFRWLPVFLPWVPSAHLHLTLTSRLILAWVIQVYHPLNLV